MSNTNVTLPQSAIPLVGFLPTRICYLLVLWLGPVRVTCEEDSDDQVSQQMLRKSNLMNKGLLNLYL